MASGGMFYYRSAMPYESVILGPRYARRLDDLRATDAIEVECPPDAGARSWPRTGSTTALPRSSV
jgi:hypothetical protein